MKLVLIMLIATAAVAIGATFDGRIRRASGADYYGAGAYAGGSGDHVAAKSGVVEKKDATISQSAASADRGSVGSSSVIQSIKVRDSGNDENARAERALF